MAAEFNPQFQKIGEILVHARKIDNSKLNSALAEQKKSNEKIGQVLISMGAIDEDDFITAFSMQMGYPKADNFLLLEADQDAVRLIPEDFSRTNSVLAVKKSDKVVTIVMEDPEDLATIDSVKRLTGLDTDIVVVGSELLNKAMDQLYGEITKPGQVEEAIQ